MEVEKIIKCQKENGWTREQIISYWKERKISLPPEYITLKTKTEREIRPTKQPQIITFRPERNVLKYLSGVRNKSETINSIILNYIQKESEEIALVIENK